MRPKLLDCVVLKRDLPEYGLKKGDLGAIVEIYDEENVEVEFIKASGKPLAIVTLPVKYLSKIRLTDVIAVRPG